MTTFCSSDTVKKGINGDALKYIAIIAMTLDHIAWLFVPLDSVLGQIMHLIGRTTAPIMCYFIAEGYYHTKNIKKYILRLAIFALISHIPFTFFQTGGIVFGTTSVIFTLLCGLIALWTYENIKNIALKIIIIVILCIISYFGDWMFFAVLWILFFGKYRLNKKKQFIAFSLIGAMFLLSFLPDIIALGIESLYSTLFQAGIYLSLIPLYFYNGQKGKGGKFSKWFFYIYYPLHLIILASIKLILI